MEKINSIHKGHVWLNVYRTDDGRVIFTVGKSYLTTQGWRRTQFFRPDIGDVEYLMEALQVMQSVQEANHVRRETPSIFASEEWIDEEELPVREGLRIIKVADPDYGMTEEEIEDRNEFILCYILKSHETLLSIPKQHYEADFFVTDFEQSAFNTGDFQRLHPSNPFDRYAYAIKKVIERAKDLAILHSCISDAEGRERTRRRFESLIRKEFGERLSALANRAMMTEDTVKQAEIQQKILDVKRRVIQCRKIWEQFAPRDA